MGCLPDGDVYFPLTPADQVEFLKIPEGMWTAVKQARLGERERQFWFGEDSFTKIKDVEIASSLVTQSCPTLRDRMDYSPPGSSLSNALKTIDPGGINCEVVLLYFYV